MNSMVWDRVTKTSQIAALVLYIATFFFAFWLGTKYAEQMPGPTPVEPEPIACSQEAKICPDGSAVGRVPPSCDFAPCPGE